MTIAALSIALPALQDGREIVLLAEQESRDNGFGFLDTEHLLLAAVTLCGGNPRLREVLELHGLTAARLRHAIDAFVGAGAVCPDGADRIACTPAAVRVLARSAQRAGPTERVRPSHVLLAILDGVDDPLMGAAHDVLDGLGIEPRRLRRALHRAARAA